MKLRTKAALSGLGLAALVAGCAGASHIGALQPPGAPSPAATPATTAHMVSKPGIQLGIDVDWYTWPGQDITSGAAATVAYIKSLHANSVSVSFPFFTHGLNPASVHSTSATPTTAQLAIFVRDAEQAGLYVSLRPLLDESSLGISRVGWIPSSIPAFMASYRHWIRPYLDMAQLEHVPEFIEASELTGFDASPVWNSFDRFARAHYRGQLACAANWDRLVPGMCGGVKLTVDAYPRGISASQELVGWKAYDAALPSHIVETEVGIAAVKGAPSQPWRVKWHTTQLDPGVQARWFTAACHAATQEHLAGIYFWSVGMGKPIRGPTAANEGAWAGSAGASAISACFASVEVTH